MGGPKGAKKVPKDFGSRFPPTGYYDCFLVAFPVVTALKDSLFLSDVYSV